MLRHAAFVAPAHRAICAICAICASCASAPSPLLALSVPRGLVALSPIAATAVASPATAGGEVIASADGRTTNVARPCAPDPSPPAERVFSCTSTPEWPRREWSFEGAGRVLDVRQEMALIARTHAMRMTARSDTPGAREVEGSVLRTEEVMLFEIDRARWFTPQLVEPTADWVRVGFTADGEVLGLARTGHGPSATTWIVHGPLHDYLEMTRIDRPADDIARAASGDYLVTVGDAAFVIGAQGLSARSVTLPAGVRLAAAVQPATPQHAGERVRCVGRECTVDDRVTLTLRDDRSVP